jgi:hypothetical protein
VRGYYNYLKISQFPDYTLSYRSLDLQATKTFEFPNDSMLQLRFDVLNVTNYENYAEYFDGYPGLPYFNKDGNITGVPRTFKVGMNFKW